MLASSRLLAVAILIGAGCGATPASAPPRPSAGAAPAPAPRRGGLSVDIDLTEWGLDNVADIHWASIGVSEGNLSLYDLRKQPPPTGIAEPPAAIDLRGGRYVVGRFLATTVNRLGGPSRAIAGHGGSANADSTGSGILLRYAVNGGGFGGLWFPLFAPDRKPASIDLGAARYLKFAIRGARGGEKVELRIADEPLQQKEDSAPVGDVARFVPSARIDRNWQVATVPVMAFPPSIDVTRLASLVILGKGAGQVTIRDVEFSMAAETPPLPPPSTEGSGRKGMWLWRSQPLLDDAAAVRHVFELCQRQQITDVFLQVPAEGARLEKIRPLVAGLRRAGLRVEALDGAPDFALPNNHRNALRLVETVNRYNHSGAAIERFDGVHLDVEPYLLPGFGGVGRELILRGYWEMLNQVAGAARLAGLPLTVNMPVWYDSKDRFGVWTTSVGGRPLSELVIELADAVALMDYRTEPRKVVASAVSELTYAEALGKRVFIGVETVALPDETLYDLAASGSGTAVLRFEPLGGKRVRVTFAPKGPGGGALMLHEANHSQVPGTQLSFANSTMAELNRVTDAARAELSDWASFLGFALHDLTSLETLLTRP